MTAVEIASVDEVYEIKAKRQSSSLSCPVMYVSDGVVVAAAWLETELRTGPAR